MSVRTAVQQQSSRSAPCTALPKSDAGSLPSPSSVNAAPSGLTEQLKALQEGLRSFLYANESPNVANALDSFEQKTGAKREHLAYGVAGLVSLYLVLGSSAELVVNLIGVLYPASESIKAIREQKGDHTQWLTYWAVFGLLSLVDSFAEGIYQVFPLIYLAKALTLLYLYLPQTRGASALYSRVVDPLATRLEARSEKAQ